MMNDEARHPLLQALATEGSAPSSVWAVLDGARSPAIHLALIESRLEYRSLYSGRLPPELGRASPQLVELPAGHRLRARLLDAGLGRSWGIFLVTDEPDNLRHHLRRWLKVRSANGRRYLFRFYDPRVLRAWLPTCTPDELARFFGPVQRFVCEGAGGRSVCEFALERGVLVTRQRDVLPALSLA